MVKFVTFFCSSSLISIMDAFVAYFQSQYSFGRGWSYEALNNFRQISPVVQQHLKQVYLTLCCALVASAAGAYLHLLWNIGGILTTLGCIGCIVWLLATPVFEERKRVGLLMASFLLQGATVGPLIEFFIELDPSILVSAFVGTAVAFGCFLAAATLARRREYLYLGGLLSAGLSILFWLQFASSIFGGSTAIFKVELYFGLLVFLGYMVVDTEEIIERAHFGDLDYVKHALTLFIGFVRVVVGSLLSKNAVVESEEEEEEEKKKKKKKKKKKRS